MAPRKSAAAGTTATTAAAAVAVLALLSGAPAPALAADQMVGYIPPASKGCPSNVKVQLQASSNSGGWFSSPTVSGRATVLNGESYSVPVQDVTIMIFPANSPVAPVYANCWGIGNGQRVPYSPIPFQYGRASCQFESNLPTNGPSAGARNWQQARAVATLTNGAKCYSDMTYIDYNGGGGGWPWGGSGGGSVIIGGANPSSGGMIGSSMGGSGMGMGGSMGGSGMGGSGMGMGSSRMVGGAKPSSSSSSSGGNGGGGGGTMMVGGAKPPTMLGGANPNSGGGRKMLGVPAAAVRA